MGKKFVKCDRISKKMRETINQYRESMLENERFQFDDDEDHTEHTMIVYTNAIIVKRNKPIMELEEEKLYEDVGNMNAVRRLENDEKLNYNSDADEKFDILDTFYYFDQNKDTPRDMDRDLCRFLNEFDIDYIFN